MPSPRPRSVSPSFTLPLCAAALLAAAVARAQPGAPAGPYERAARLVEQGQGSAGRALTDSLVAAADAGTPVLGEALWQRAALAGDAAGAERDLRRIVAELPWSPRAGPATVRLAQLALLRGRPDEATALLAPLRDAPAAYWRARARLERADTAGACAALDAVSAAPPDDRVTHHATQLRRRVPVCTQGAPPVAVAAAPPPPAPPPAAPPPSPPAPRPAPNTAPSAPPPLPTPDSRLPAFSVQIAAYATASEARTAAARLRADGLDARAEGQGAAGDRPPFRVKLGRYPTRAAAAAALREFGRRGVRGFVTDAGPAR